MSFEQFFAKVTRPFYWSPLPPYRYHNGFHGWSHLVELNLGMFNLAWACSEVKYPPLDYVAYANKLGWIITHSEYLKLGGLPLADQAFSNTHFEFCNLLSVTEKEWLKWSIPETHPADIVNSIINSYLINNNSSFITRSK